MSSRNQNKPPPRSPPNKISSKDDLPLDKRRKIGNGRLLEPTKNSRNRQALAAVNTKPETSTKPEAASAAGDVSVTDGGTIEFAKDEIALLMNDKTKAKKYDQQEKIEQVNGLIKRLKQCIKWFQNVEEGHIQEQEKLKFNLDSAERKSADIEDAMRKKEDELNAIIEELKNKNVSLQENLRNEELLKLEAIECHKKEIDSRINVEKLLASMKEELGKTEQKLSAAKCEVTSLTDKYKQSQEYNTSLQQYNTTLQRDLATANESVKRVEKEKSAIVENLSTLRGHYKLLEEQLTSSKISQEEAVKQRDELLKEVGVLRNELQQVREDRDQKSSNLQDLTAEFAKHKELTGKSVAEIDSLNLKMSALEETCFSQREQIRILHHQLNAANEKLKMADLSTSETIKEFEEKKRVVHELQEKLGEAELQLTEGERLRKKLHNTILELKGNIRVFCRVRPLLPDDGPVTEAVVSYPTFGDSLGRGIDLVQTGQKHPFTFDKVFSHDASQEDVFVEISQLVQSALDGYKVCIFAYGQTGSGKTYTMMGRPEAHQQKGLIPRSLEQIFQTSQSLSTQGWKYKMQASMLEIYNETIRDLLAVRSSSLEITRTDNGGGAGKQYAIRHDSEGNTYVSDLTIVDVCSIKEVSSLLQKAGQSRSVGRTDMNEQSSRSHFVFTLRISGTNESTEQQVQGVLNLIDLAGSERLSKSGATGERLKETQAINKSLSCLSDVIFALAKKEDHVPFRNSKLTYLLQPCLGGDSKTLMVVNISPDPSSLGESLCSLRFAARVNTCEIGIPRRQTIKPLDSRLSYG